MARANAGQPLVKVSQEGERWEEIADQRDGMVGRVPLSVPRAE